MPMSRALKNVMRGSKGPKAGAKEKSSSSGSSKQYKSSPSKQKENDNDGDEAPVRGKMKMII